MFQQPSQGDQVKIAELTGSLALFWVREYREEIMTQHGPADAVACDVHVLDGDHGGEKFENTLIFQRALIGSLRSAIGGEPVLGRIGQGVAKPGKTAPYVLNPFTDADAALATTYIQNMAKPFQPPAGQGPTTTAPGATPPAATAPPAAPAGNGGIDLSQLPPEVRELIAQSLGK